MLEESINPNFKEFQIVDGNYPCQKLYKEASESILVSKNEVNCPHIQKGKCLIQRDSPMDDYFDDVIIRANPSPIESICLVWESARAVYIAQSSPKYTNEKINICENCLRQEKTC